MTSLLSKFTDVIHIYPQAKRHQYFSLLSGVVTLLICLLCSNFWWHSLKLPLMVILFASIVLILVGLMKLSEPNHSFVMRRDKLCFKHRYGHWQILWKHIVRIDQVRAYIHGTLTPLPYIGIKLNGIDNIAEHISPRLASRLLHEQKELLILAAKNKEIVLENGLIDFSPYKYGGKTYRGPVAAWLHRTEQLVAVYGFHLYLPIASLDRELNDFLTLLKSCKQYALATIEKD